MAMATAPLSRGSLQRTAGRSSQVAAKMRIHRPVVFDLPDDLGERIEAFRKAAGLSVRALARLLGVSPHRVREWRRGVAPDSRNLYLLLMVAGRMGLRNRLERPGDDLPAEVGRQLSAARGGDGRPQGRSLPPRGSRDRITDRPPPRRRSGRRARLRRVRARLPQSLPVERRAASASLPQRSPRGGRARPRSRRRAPR